MKNIFAIETSCDETAAAVVQNNDNRIILLSNIIASSAKLQSKYGGIIPEQAAREQIKAIIPVIEIALRQAQCKPKQLDAIAVTQGPGLIGSLLVGVETAKTLSLVWNKPLIPVNHLIGHFYANWITSIHLPGVKAHLGGVATAPSFPCIGLLVSGGHTDLVLFQNHGAYKYLGGTRDDAAGECFDKSARLLGLPYPGGPEISKLAQKGDPAKYKLPRPMLESGNFDFSFSGLKTAASTLVETAKKARTEDICASIEAAIVDVLVTKTIKAAQAHNIKQIIIAGGVAANSKLTDQLRNQFHGHVHTPPAILCTDNAAMIGSAAFFIKPSPEPLHVQANPNLSLVV